MPYFAPYIDASGIHMPTYADRLEDLCSAYRSIFGRDAELTPAVPDYQLLSVFAKALDDTSAFVLSAYNSRNPAYASGQALDLLLPQYGLTRLPGETDAEARARMNLALAGNGIFTLDAMEAEIRKIPNVAHLMFRVNDEGSAVDGIPPHSLAAYVSGGNAGLIAQAIWNKKPPGLETSGTLNRTVTDAKGQSHTVKFSRPTMLPIHFQITLKTYDGYDQDAVQTAFRSALMNYVNKTLEIGDPINIPGLYGMLYQSAGAYATTFAITDLSVSGSHGVAKDLLTPAWNAIFTLASSSEVVVIIANN